MTGGQACSDKAVREQIRAAVEAIDGALRGIVSFLAPLKPTLRNELIQLLGDKVERARAAKESLEKLLAELELREKV
ncbi:MAG: hypothetical protein ACREJ6_15060 [Candidatus Methylomirabilis sp.]